MKIEYNLYENDKIIATNTDFMGLVIRKKLLQKENPKGNYKLISPLKSWTDIYNKIINHTENIYPDWRNINPIFMSNALAGEVGEICNLTKKLSGGGTNKLNKAEIIPLIKYEIADVFTYLIMLSETLGFSENELIDSFYIKHEIVKQRVIDNNKGG